MTSIATPRDLFLHQLQTMLWLERKLADELLPELFENVHAADLKLAVGRHQLETAGHVENLLFVLASQHEPERPEERTALLGLQAAHDFLMQRIDAANTEVSDLFHLDVIARTEHLEIAAYTWLVHAAEALGVAREAALLLRENMEQEEHALEQAEHALAKLLAEKVESR